MIILPYLGRESKSKQLFLGRRSLYRPNRSTHRYLWYAANRFLGIDAVVSFDDNLAEGQFEFAEGLLNLAPLSIRFICIWPSSLDVSTVPAVCPMDLRLCC